jgi:hypothetical protein
VIEADGALEAKLAAYVAVMPKIFESLKGSPMVPLAVGTNGNGNGNVVAKPPRR